MFWVVLSAVLAASVVEDEVSKARGLVLMDNEASRRQRAALRSPLAQGLAERIMDLVAAITRGMGYTAGAAQLVSRVRGTTRKLRKGLLAALAGAGPDELNYVLAAVNAPALLEVAGGETVRLLTRTRVHELTVASRAAIVDAFQKLGLRYRPERQAAVRDVLLATRGAALTRLKAYIDDGGDYHSCYKLVYNDLQGAVREQVLAHITREGLRVGRAFRRRVGAGASPGAVLKVLSDVDDTLFASGGAWPAGVDARYPRKCFYPGAFSLYAELDRSFAARYAGALAEVEAELAAEDSVAVPTADAGPGFGLGRGHGARLAAVDEDEAESRERPLAAGRADDDASPPQTPRMPSNPNLPTPFLAAAQGGAAPAPAAQLPPRPLAPGRSPSRDRAAAHASTPLPPLRIPHGLQRDDTFGLLSPGGSGTSPLFGDGPAGALATDPRSPRPGEACDPLLRAPSFHLGAPGAASRTHQEGSNLVFLSARPESYKGMTEAEAHRRYFGPAVARHDLDTSPSMLLGSLDSGPRALLSYLRLMNPPKEVLASAPATAAAAVAMAQMLAAKKLSRAREYAAIYPEAAFVLVGDNGQGDVLTAEVLWSSLRPGAEAAQGRAAGATGSGHGRRAAERRAARALARDASPGSAASELAEGDEAEVGEGDEAEVGESAGDEVGESASLEHEGESLTPRASPTHGESSSPGPEAERADKVEPSGDPGARAPQSALRAGSTESVTSGAPKPSGAQGAATAAPALSDDPSHQINEPKAKLHPLDAPSDPTHPQKDEYASRLVACFIHRVVPLANTFSMLSSKPGSDGGPPRTAELRERWAQRDIYFLHTHVGMAAQAYGLDLLDLSALHRVASTARNDFLRIWGRYGHRASGRNLPEALRQLNKDLAWANELLPVGLQVDPLEWPGERDTRGYARQPSDIARNPSPAVSDVSTRLAVAQ